jgi:hypothetical protein
MIPRLSPRSLGRFVVVLACLALVILSARDASASAGFVYAVTKVNGGATQIYGYRINPVTGTLTILPGFPMASGGVGGPGFLSEYMVYNHGLLFVLNGLSASLSVFTVNSATGALTPAPYSPVALGGDVACVAASPTSSVVAVGSNAGMWSLVLTSTTATVAPGSPFAVGDASPFSCSFSRDGLYVYTGGNDGTTIAGFSVAPTTGVLTPLAGSPFESGDAYPLAYVGDNTGRLFVSNVDGGVRAFTTSSGVPTGVAGNPFPSGITGGVHGILHPSGFYMVAARETNKVGVFRIAGSGAGTTLTAVAGSPFASGGTLTDAVTLAAGGAFVVAANGITRNLTTFSVNTATGALSSVGTQPVNSLGASGLIVGVAFAPAGGPLAGDFDGDGTSDISVFRPSTGQWFIRHSSTNFATFSTRTFGVSSDTIVPGDYDGDGKSDPAVYRPSTGTWFMLNSGTNYTTSSSVAFGLSTDKPVPGDYDGDRKADPAVYRPSTGQWIILKSTTNYTSSLVKTFGVSTDIPVAADFDADGKFDPAVYRPSTFQWFALLSGTDYMTSFAVTWGSAMDTPVVGDYDGDGKADLTVFRPSSGNWFVLRSSTNFSTSQTFTFGVSTDTPVPADYDGDSKASPAVFRPSTGGWFTLKSSSNYTTSFSVPVWGVSTDRPVNKRP